MKDEVKAFKTLKTSKHFFHPSSFILAFPYVYKNLHRAAADHAFLAGLVGGQLEMVQGWRARAHRLARFGPDFGFDAAAADRARHLAVLEEEHLRPAPLRGRAARVRHGRHHDALAARVSIHDQSIELALRNRAHKVYKQSARS